MPMLLTVKEAAKELKVAVPYVYKLLNSGLLPYLKLGSRKIRSESLEKFIAEYEGQDVDKIMEGIGEGDEEHAG